MSDYSIFVYTMFRDCRRIQAFSSFQEGDTGQGQLSIVLILFLCELPEMQSRVEVGVGVMGVKSASSVGNPWDLTL